MKIVTLIARILLGLVFTVFGLNGFFNFLPMPPMPPGPGAIFMGILLSTHYFLVVKGLEVAGGALLLVNRRVPLALTLLGPVIVNIFLFHAFMEPSGLGTILVIIVLWAVQFWANRQAFAGILGTAK